MLFFASKTIIRESRKEDGSVIKLATLKDIISNMSVFMRHCVKEGYSEINPFTGLDLKDLCADESVDSCVPFSKAELHQLFNVAMPEEDRLLLAILTVKGMRLDEAALLTWDQVQEEDGVRFLSLLDSENQKVIVKTQGSLRSVPLSDALTLPEKASGRLFSYKFDIDGKIQKEAFKQLMKHVRHITKMKTKAVHSLRGTFKDLLRDADVSKKLNDFITDHAAGDVAGKYGSGFSLQRRYEAINSVKHHWLKN
jgi:integrase